jgi:anion-transporting  ArsA/GET3 family ATPase
MKDLLKKGSTVVLLGTGGVGKTTVAAALGLAAAACQLETVVITVDPARRLRDALGLERLGGKPMRLSTARLAAAGLDPSLKLSAMVLDVKGAWDALVERFATDPATRHRILDNPFYHNLTEQFAGSEAYAALQQLYDIRLSGEFEIEVVDTPPAAHAFEFINAPARLTRLLDSRSARWLFMPYFSAGRFAMRLASRAARFIVRDIEHFAGPRVLSSISEFFVAASEAVEAVAERFHKTEALLRSPSVRFILVTTAEEDRLLQARDLIHEMKAEGLHLSAIVINRFLDEESWEELSHSDNGVSGRLDEIDALRGLLGNALSRDAGLGALVDYLEDYGDRARRDIARVARFAHQLPPSVKLAIAPEIKIGVRDLRALSHVADFLIGAKVTPRHLDRIAAQTTNHQPRPDR